MDPKTLDAMADDALTKLSEAMDYYELLQQMPFYDDLCKAAPAAQPTLVQLHESAYILHTELERLKARRQTGQTSDATWAEAVMAVHEGTQTILETAAPIRQTVNDYRAAHGLAAVNSERPLN